MLTLLFTKGNTYRVDEIPGCVSVPAGKFTVKELCDFVKSADNMKKARDFAQKYIDSQRSWELAIDQLKVISPECRIARKNETDWNIDRFTLATLKLTKYLQSHSPQMNRLVVFNSMMKASQTQQLIFGEGKTKGAYRVFKDLSIEIPFNFEADVLDDFIYQIFFEKELYGDSRRKINESE